MRDASSLLCEVHIHVMDGLGALPQRHAGALAVRFEIRDSASLNFSGTADIITRAETRPCSLHRHLFWDEQIRLRFPVASISTGSISIILFEIPIANGGAFFEKLETVIATSEKPLKTFLSHFAEVKGNKSVTLMHRTSVERRDSVISLSPIPEALSTAGIPGELRIRIGMIVTPSKPDEHHNGYKGEAGERPLSRSSSPCNT